MLGFLIMLIPILGWIMGPILIAIGLVMYFVKKGKARYQCPNCNYST